MQVSSDTNCSVDFESPGIQVSVAPHTTLLEAAQQAGLLITASCGGQGRCGQCRLSVFDGPVSPPADNEKSLLPGHLLDAGVRLACSTRVLGNVKVHVPRTSLASGMRIPSADAGFDFEVAPCVHASTVTIPTPGMNEQSGDNESVDQALAAVVGRDDITADPAVVRQLSALMRQYQGRINTYRRGNEMVGAAPSDDPPLGVAVDLGSTKIAASLVDLTNGKELAVAGEFNPQIAFGEDVISRLTYALRNADGLDRLASKVRTAIDGLIGELTARAEVSRYQVADLCIVGNTVMTHLLLKLPVDRLAVAPFVASTLEAVDIKARDLGLEAAPGAYVHILPGIGGFVGADHVAMILSSGLDSAEGVAIGIDIGTNTEIVLVDSNRGKRMAASCASGPAFEGSHIQDGMRASSGAIEAVCLTDHGVALKTVNDAPPLGLCGSGIIDAVSELRRLSIINARGRFSGVHSRLREGTSGKEFVLAPAHLSGNKQDVVITQEDINQIQLAKGAIRAGLECLLELTGTRAEDVREVVIAGAFGSFLNIVNACHIGLLPDFPNAGYRQIGNAALQGARRALLSRHERQRAVQIAADTICLELTRVTNFRRCYAKGMQFLEYE